MQLNNILRTKNIIVRNLMYIHVVSCTLVYITIGIAQVYIEGPVVDSVCYGNTVSLTCSYPNIMDMVNGTNKYLMGSGEWAVNGVDLIPDGTDISRRTLSSTSEALDVTLAREQFEDRDFYYSCYLVLYNESRETSSDVEIDPPGEGVYRKSEYFSTQYE